MKVATVILMGTIALTSCATMERDRRASGYEFGSNDSREQPVTGNSPRTLQKPKGEEPYRATNTPEMKPRSKKIPVTSLPKSKVEEVFSKMKDGNNDARDASLENLAFIVAFDRQGNISLIATRAQPGKHSSRSENITKTSASNFPILIPSKATLAVKPFAITSHKGSHYMIITPPPEGTEAGDSVAPVIVYFGPPHPCPPNYDANPDTWKDDC